VPETYVLDFIHEKECTKEKEREKKKRKNKKKYETV
jgi:hypothetical protein